MTRALLGISLVIAIIGLSGCETVKGVGRDITRGAEAVDRAL